MKSRARRLFPVVLTAATLLAPAGAIAQGRGGGTDPSMEPMINQSTDAMLKRFRFRNIGPASMGGRIDDIAVSESNPNVIYLGYAVGGVWRSENNGTTFSPVFDTYDIGSIGDIAIHPTNPNIVYVGTGEPNNRQTASFGGGIFKTTDGGKTFTYAGLKETQTIARIVIDPKNPETVYVAADGHLFGPNEERGIYKTTNGGRTWTKIKYIDENTGFTDIAIDWQNPSVLYAASYQRRRTTCCFNGGGPGSAVWKTTNGGQSWTKLTNGFPSGIYGRIALDISRSNPNIVYVQVETGSVGQPDEGRGRGAGGGFGGGGYDWCNNAGPDKGFRVGRGGRGGAAPEPQGPQTAPKLDPTASGVFRSDNSGGSFHIVSNCEARPMYFSQFRVDPQNPNTVYASGLPVTKSLDGGKTFATLDEAGGYGEPGHVDNHAIWIDPKNSNHIMIGNDGGLDISYDQGKSWDWVTTMVTSLAYDVSADMRRPYWVCAGLQDNGSWCGPSSVRNSAGILNQFWFNVGGGDGFYTGMDPNDYNVVYAESQNGSTSRLDLSDGTQKQHHARRRRLIPTRRPAGAVGRGGGGGGRGGAPNVINAAPGDSYRFNWNTPYELSPHNPDIIWYGGNRLFKSVDRGDTWLASTDLTKNIRQEHRRHLRRQGDPDDAVEERRPDLLQHDHHGGRVAHQAGHRVGGYRRRQRAGHA